MCNFLSAVYLRTGRLICEPQYTDSHSDLLAAHGIKERETDAPVQQFVRLELTPPNPFVLDLSKWTECVDEREAPEWFDAAKKFDAFEQMREIIRASVITDTRDTLLGGFYILADKAVVKKMRGTKVGVMLGSSQVGEMWDSSQVGVMLGSSQVGEMYGSSQVGEMFGSSQVGEMYGSSQVGEMYGSSQVGKMFGSSQVGKMFGSSQVGEMYGSSQVGKMWDSSQVGEMLDSSQVLSDRRTTKEVPR